VHDRLVALLPFAAGWALFVSVPTWLSWYATARRISVGIPHDPPGLAEGLALRECAIPLLGTVLAALLALGLLLVPLRWRSAALTGWAVAVLAAGASCAVVGWLAPAEPLNPLGVVVVYQPWAIVAGTAVVILSRPRWTPGSTRGSS